MAPLAARFGLTPAATNRCVSDPAGAAWLQAAYGKAKEAGVQSTPTFLINGKRVEFNNAAELSALLK
jgi:protein-disulfide isomerase